MTCSKSEHLKRAQEHLDRIERLLYELRRLDHVEDSAPQLRLVGEDKDKG